jgi:1-acyl-sn-glycerol-3-phosphate acyltransferase
MPSETLPTIDDAERVRRLQAICRRDLVVLSGVDRSPLGRRLLQLLLGARLRQFAQNVGAYNADLARRGLADASQALCKRYGGRVVASGLEHVPTAGPLLVVANHPGMFDTLAIYATLPRSDVRALARPQPLLSLLPSLAPNLLMLPDEGPGRAGGLREVQRVLRAGGALLLFPAGHLEPEPALAGKHGLNGVTSDEPLGPWSSGVGTLVRRAARKGVPLQVVPTSIAGALSIATWRWFGPLVKLRRSLRGREDLAAVLQLAFPRLGPTTVRVRYGPPLAAAQLAADDADAEAITARLRAAVRAQLLEARPGRPAR